MVADASAHDDGRGGAGLVQFAVDDIVSPQPRHGFRDYGIADLSRDEADGGLQFTRLMHDIRCQATVVKQGDHLVGIARARLARVDDERLRGQAGEAECERSLVGHKVVRKRQGHHQRLVPQHVAPHAGVLPADAPETDIDPPLLQRRDLLEADHFHQAQLHIGCLRAEAADEIRQGGVNGGRGETDDKARRPLSFSRCIIIRTLSTRSSTCVACSKNSCPASVVFSGLLSRSNSCSPSSSSNCWIWRLSGGWAICSLSAARVKFRSCATATK